MSWFVRKSKGDGKRALPSKLSESHNRCSHLVSDHDGCHNPLDWTSMPSHLQQQFPHWKEQSYPSPTLKHVETESHPSLTTKPFSGNIPDNAIPYVVMENDTLVSIALKFDTKPGEIARLNKKPTVGNFPIMSGQLLYIPDTPAVQDEITVAQPAAIASNVVDVTTLTTSSSGSHDDEEVWQADLNNVESSNEWKIEEEVCDDHIHIPAKFMSEEFCVKGSLLINPQSIMFQPNPQDPLVEDHGVGQYEVLVPHSEIVHAYIKSVYNSPDGCLLSPLSPISPSDPTGHAGSTGSTPPTSSPPLIKCFSDYPPLGDGHACTDNGCNGISNSGSETNCDVQDLQCEADQSASSNDQQTKGDEGQLVSIDSSDLDCLHNVMGEDDMVSSSKSSFDEIKSKDIIMETPHSPWYFLYLRVSQSSQQDYNAPVVGIAIPLKRNELITVRTWFVFGIPSNRWEDVRNFLSVHHPSCDSGLNKPVHTSGAICEIINIGGQFSNDSLLISESHFSSWEIFSVRDFEPPRIDKLHVENSLPLPTFIEPSQLLNDTHIRKLSLNLISSAVSHDWCPIYSTFNDGISLNTLYRKMVDFEDSPTLLLVQDSFKKIFGVMVPCTLRISERFYGTGESFLFSFDDQDNLRVHSWTGSNDYIVKGSPDSIAFGSGDGHFGLWLDEDLHHGSSTHCATFNNECLATQENFIIHGVEAWGFI